MSFLPDEIRNLPSLDLLPGQKVELVLPEPAAAGYLWTVTASAQIRARLDRPLSAGPAASEASAIIGGPGRVTLHVEAPPEAIEGHVRLLLARPFEAGLPIEDFTLPVSVKAI